MELQTHWKQPGTWPMMTPMINDGQQTNSLRELSENDDDDDDDDHHHHHRHHRGGSGGDGGGDEWWVVFNPSQVSVK